MKIALICNTTSAFPLLAWLHSQGVLTGVGTVDQNSDFLNELMAVCQQRGLQIHTFSKPNLAKQLADFQTLSNPNLVLVVGFSYKIPQSVLQLPTYGFYNIHFGKLPIYGGSVPVFWQIKNQENEGVLTIHQMNERFDNGPVAVEISFEISPIQTYGMVENNYGFVAINAVFELLNNILQKNLVLKPQNADNQTFPPKPSLKDIIIDWQKMDAKAILALIKACNPWNRGAITRINGLDVRIIEGRISAQSSIKAGEIFSISQNGIDVACANNTSLTIKVLYTSLGYLEGESLGAIGIKNGDTFEQILV